MGVSVSARNESTSGGPPRFSFFRCLIGTKVLRQEKDGKTLATSPARTLSFVTDMLAGLGCAALVGSVIQANRRRLPSPSSPSRK